ncbi:Lipopolysaccharide export system ATP-binding protein LptB [Planctomycetes bacterium Pan216]|uniref:Lipopolysaccharide export system ATP-binding protein LptB n=1 Tax=Kolteria novifilia TaxID=2527975 RepID=A0A518B280_9BACT|nr:Lipopolysaccharide export system ATP-binding protein LptB [Planctomycetes bacterium Pan216]
MALLEARGLIKQYGRRTVVKGVDIDVNVGEIVGLLGPNGAGKTTTFRMMVGMISPKDGKVTFNGQEVTHTAMYKRARLGLGYLAQDSSVFRKLTVEQNLYAILELMTVRRGEPYHSNRRQRRERVDELLEQFGLTRLRKSVAMTLSGGERRRLEIARCLASEPMLIMLDEPFTGIDPKTVADIQEIIRDLRNSSIGVLITDHHVAETLRITDRSYLIADGTMLTHGTPLDIVNDKRAREVYLGKNFNAAAISEEYASTPAPAPQPAPQTQSIRQLLDAEEIVQLVNRLGGPDDVTAAALLEARGYQVVPALVQTLERSDATMRLRAAQLLAKVLGRDIDFDPEGDDVTRSRQVAMLRRMLGERLAG